MCSCLERILVVNITKWWCAHPVNPKCLTLNSVRAVLSQSPISVPFLINMEVFPQKSISIVCKKLGCASVDWFWLLSSNSLSSTHLAGRFCSHLASQPPGVPGAPAHPHPLLVHGRPCALRHPVPGLLPEHPRHHPRPEWAGAGGTSLELMAACLYIWMGWNFTPSLCEMRSQYTQHTRWDVKCQGVSTGTDSWRIHELWRWKGS